MATSEPGAQTDLAALRRRLALGLLGIAALIVFYAVIYWWAMGTIEERPVAFVEALQVVVESITTAGFGGHAPWEAWQLNLLVLLMNLTGVAVVFVSIPLLVVPLLRRAIGTAPPTETTLTDHVVICGHSPMDDVLREELEAADIPYLFVESDPEEAVRLVEQGVDVIYGNAERVETLRRANLEDATALVADLDDETNPTVILSADRINPDLTIVSVVQNREAEPHHRFAGADEVVVSKQSLGESLAKRAMKTVPEQFKRDVDVPLDFQIWEYLVEEGSELVGQTIEEVDVFDDPGITVVGGWFGARFLVSPPPDTEIQTNTILLISGESGALEECGVRKLPSHQRHPDRVIVCGYGEVGSAVAETLEAAEIDVTVIDQQDLSGVDVVGDATSARTLRRADIENARSMVLALDDDATAIYTAIQATQVAPDLEIIARTNEPETLWKLYNAGADYVLSLPSVTGEILASRLIEGEQILTPHDEIAFVTTPAPAIEGQTLGAVSLRERTGATVIGVARNGDVFTDVGPDFQIEPGDELVAVGTEEAIETLCSVVTEEGPSEIPGA